MNNHPPDVEEDEGGLKKRFQELRSASFEDLVRRVITGILWLLIFGSLTLSLLSFFGSLTGSAAVRVLLVAVFVATLIPTVLQAIDWFRDSDSSHPSIIDRTAKRVDAVILRRKQAKFITMYGRQEIAKKLSPETADSFSVGHQMLARRRISYWATGAVGLAVLATVSAILVSVSASSGRQQVQPSIGQAFHIDSAFSITVLSAPKCSKGACNVEMTFLNTSGYTADIGAGSFADPEQVGTAELCNPSPLAGSCSLSPPVSYDISLIEGDNHYGYVGAQFNSNNLLPEEKTAAEFTFDVPAGARIGELELSGESADALVAFPTSGQLSRAALERAAQSPT